MWKKGLGLLGSAEWVKEPTLPLDKAVAMLNMDMIGRIKDDKVYIGGVGTGSSFRRLLEHEQNKSTFKIEYSAGGYSASDHTSFVAKQIPVLFFFSGLHADYHKPSDTWEKINAGAAAHLLDFIDDIALKLDSASERAAFVTVVEDQSAGHTTGGCGGGYGPYFGSIPDFGQEENGVKFSDVRPGSPAAKADLKAGDIPIVQTTVSCYMRNGCELRQRVLTKLRNIRTAASSQYRHGKCTCGTRASPAKFQKPTVLTSLSPGRDRVTHTLFRYSGRDGLPKAECVSAS